MANHGGERPTTIVDNPEGCSPRQLARVWNRLRSMAVDGEASRQFNDSKNNDPVNLDLYTAEAVEIHVVSHRHNNQPDDSVIQTARGSQRVETIYVLYADTDGARLGVYHDELEAERQLEEKLTKLFDAQDKLTEGEFEEGLGVIRERFNSIKQDKHQRLILDMGAQQQSTLSGSGAESLDALLTRLVPRNYGAR
jgi:hypothetical protein